MKVLGVWGGACVEASKPGRMRWTRGYAYVRKCQVSWHLLDYRIIVQRPEKFFFTLEALRGSLILGRIENR